MFSRLVQHGRTRMSRRTMQTGGVVAAVGVSGLGGYYYYTNHRRHPASAASTDASSSSTPSPSTDATLSSSASSPSPPENPSPTADFVLPPAPPASRVINHYWDYLRQDESSMIIDDPSVGFSRSDSCIYLSNPGLSEGLNTWLRLPYNHTCSFFMIFEGHKEGGIKAVQWLRSYLLDAVLDSLTDLYTKYAPYTPEHSDVDTESHVPVGYPPPESIDASIKETFLALDDDLVQKPLTAFFERPSKVAAVNLESGRAGSSALVAFYESETKTLRVALTGGTTRAILGRRVGRRRRGEDLYEVYPLTDVQDWSNPMERERLKRAHPNEDLDALFRLPSSSSSSPSSSPSSQPTWRLTRSFGDAALKWSTDVQKRLHSDFLGDPPHPSLLTAPYTTSEPIIHSIQIQQGDFLVLATSPIWSSLSNEEAVGLVGWWINDRHPRYGNPKVVGTGHGTGVGVGMGASGVSGAGVGTASYSRYGRNGGQNWNKYSYTEDDLSLQRTRRTEDLPIQPIASGSSSSQVVKSETSSNGVYKKWNTEKRFINVDPNAATHLARNALGGADRDLTEALLNMGYPYSSRMRGDIGVSVVFFNDTPPEDFDS